MQVIILLIEMKKKKQLTSLAVPANNANEFTLTNYPYLVTFVLFTMSKLL